MKRTVVVIVFVTMLLFCLSVNAEERFGRKIISLENPNDYQYFRLDDVNFPVLTKNNFDVSCLVYRGTENYYVEISIQNRSTDSITIPANFLDFSKPGYTVYQVDPNTVVAKLASAEGAQFIPTPPPQVAPIITTTTNLNANANTYGNTTIIDGTATSTTTTDNSSQAGANFGNAIGNAIAAHRFYKAQATAIAFAHYLSTYRWTGSSVVLPSGSTQRIVMIFQQAKPKKAHFEVVIHLGEQDFSFKYKE